MLFSLLYCSAHFRSVVFCDNRDNAFATVTLLIMGHLHCVDFLAFFPYGILLQYKVLILLYTHSTTVSVIEVYTL